MSTSQSADARTALMTSLLLRYPQAGKEGNAFHSVLKTALNNTSRTTNHHKFTPATNQSNCAPRSLDRTQYFTTQGRTIYDAQVMQTPTPQSLLEGTQNKKENSCFYGFPALREFDTSKFDGSSSTGDLDMMDIDQPYGDQEIFDEFLKVIQNGLEGECLREHEVGFRYHTPVSEDDSRMSTPALSPARSMDSYSDIIGYTCDVEMNSDESMAQEMFNRFIDVDKCMDTIV
ncbi:hypothetical protein SERLA73DRAFT_174245 [Serpula lacrymans var. lacrymans S7.3]|uniref:Uncharacterized protein n=1 Tax=Serpula lacrymans var. lacrymans (strain S7.3) TaxID=936435 RepID=F8PF32_SERL3|nr:hypothetical protein SERLA73DRAFT_174245 [Serpula lacrymans var. lacrymans S7.3]